MLTTLLAHGVGASESGCGATVGSGWGMMGGREMMGWGFWGPWGVWGNLWGILWLLTWVLGILVLIALFRWLWKKGEL